MRMRILRTLILVFTFALSAGARDISFDDFSGELNDIKALSLVPAASLALDSAREPAEIKTPDEIKTPAETPQWLVMVFINARNDLWMSGIQDINEMEMIGSTAKVAVTAELGILQDKGNSTRFFIQKDTDTSNITSPGIMMKNSDMGSWKHFVNFAKWSIKRYPAKRYMVILWNHGSGRIDIGGADNTGAELGIAYDDLTRNFIRNSQLALALEEISRYAGKKIDVFSSDACLMQMLSVAYEIKDHAEYLVQSEEIVPVAGFPYDTILASLNANPYASAKAASGIIIDKFQDFYQIHNDNSHGTTISAVDSSKFGRFNNLLNLWIRLAVKSNRANILAALSETLSFEYGYDGNDTSGNARSKDLYDFIENVNAKADKESELYKAGIALQKHMAGVLISSNKITGPDMKYNRAKGLAVYAPKMIYDTSYDEMLVSRDTLWDDFIKWILDKEYGVK